MEKTEIMRISRELCPVGIMVDKKQMENAKYFRYLGSTITHGARCTRDIKPGFVTEKTAFNKKTQFFSKLDL